MTEPDPSTGWTTRVSPRRPPLPAPARPTMTSRVLGLAREQVMAYLFGAGNAVDAFNVAFRIPNLVRDLFAEGAMSAAFVPDLHPQSDPRRPGAAWRLGNNVVTAFCSPR